MTSYGLTNGTFAEEELLDGDSDGLTAWREWVSDTNPTNEGSVLQLTGLEINGAEMDVFWKGGVLATQVLERCTNLLSGSWVPLFANHPPSSTSDSFMDSGATNKAGFYRVKAW